ncbi:MAG: class I SAM-dependent methyltransferase [Candidatus Peribacteraceae bacterium]|nr:class I SAM-dependent methyltransferase [Candidatus Peribacteraceae bacterium]
MLADFVLIGAALVIVLAVLSAAAHLRTRTPYGGTPPAVAQAMVVLAGLRSGETALDPGAGDARLLIAAERACPGIRAVGYELSPAVWLCGRVRLFLSRSGARLYLRDALCADVSAVDVVFLYAGPEMMRAFAEKFARELRPGTRIVSHFFRLPGREPVTTQEVATGRKKRRVFLYVW